MTDVSYYASTTTYENRSQHAIKPTITQKELATLQGKSNPPIVSSEFYYL